MKLPCLLLIAGLVAAAGAQAQTPAPAPQMPSREAALKTVMEACKTVTPQLCPGLSGNTALACLETNIEKLTPGCKDAVVKLAKLNL
jgi:hypothetical protein